MMQIILRDDLETVLNFLFIEQVYKIIPFHFYSHQIIKQGNTQNGNRYIKRSIIHSAITIDLCQYSDEICFANKAA